MNLDDGEGVMVAGVRHDGPAADDGIREGDIILEVNRNRVPNVETVKKELSNVKDDNPLLLLVRRANGMNQYASLTAEK